MKIYYKRGLNKNEKYVCSQKALKRFFSEHEIRIGMGVTKSFEFDHATQHRPEIKGTVVMSITVNCRRATEKHASLSLYAFDCEQLFPKEQMVFEDVYLPQIYEWYVRTIDADVNQYCGIYQLLVVRNNGEYTLCQLKYR